MINDSLKPPAKKGQEVKQRNQDQEGERQRVHPRGEGRRKKEHRLQKDPIQPEEEEEIPEDHIDDYNTKGETYEPQIDDLQKKENLVKAVEQKANQRVGDDYASGRMSSEKDSEFVEEAKDQVHEMEEKKNNSTDEAAIWMDDTTETEQEQGSLTPIKKNRVSFKDTENDDENEEDAVEEEEDEGIDDDQESDPRDEGVQSSEVKVKEDSLKKKLSSKYSSKSKKIL